MCALCVNRVNQLDELSVCEELEKVKFAEEVAVVVHVAEANFFVLVHCVLEACALVGAAGDHLLNFGACEHFGFLFFGGLPALYI